MNPAFSVVFFTTLAGAAQGLVVTLAVTTLLGRAPSTFFALLALVVALLLAIGGLGASFLHLGRPERAWRAVLMWRTSWLSREVIVLPAFIGVVAIWALAVRADAEAPWSVLLPLAAIAVALLLWYCTAMIYACLRFVQEWAHPLTIVNFTLLGMASGLLLASALGAVAGEVDFVRRIAPWAFGVTVVAWITRIAALRRNATLKPKSTLQSASGIKSKVLVQKSMGMSAGSFNTREFMHGMTSAVLKRIRLGFLLGTFALPLGLLAVALLAGGGAPLLVAAALVQYLGLLAERWFFFAQARHPQNLYYQVVS
jgi:DMSO reductase anchor subunit